MEHIITRRRGFRKLLAFLLCMASILGLLMETTTAPRHLTPILPTMQTEPSTYTPVPGAMLTGTIC